MGLARAALARTPWSAWDETVTAPLLIVWGSSGAAVLLSWLYFRRYRLARPPIGVFDLFDVGIIVIAAILIPFIYLALPTWLAAGLFGLGLLSVLYYGAEPVLSRRWFPWFVSLALLGADLACAAAFGPASADSRAISDVVLVAAVVGASNLWAQGGMKACDLAGLAAILTVYDFVATVRLSVMDDVLGRLASSPFAPSLAWGSYGGAWLEIGLGDLLLASLFPLVMLKAFGRSAGLAALALSICSIGVMLTVAASGFAGSTFPAMVGLGPLIVLQYAYCARHQGPERTTRQYLEAETRPTARPVL
jgi:hypothetical protein